MMRSLFSGVSGLKIHQTKMDVIGNNISNVNTVGYKSSRVTFQEVFSQSLSGASSANAESGRGGVNPMQIGLGAGLATIDKIMTQGAAQRTDRLGDLMISGDGFFIVGDGSNRYYTRYGAMNIDPEGNLTLLGSGMKVYGWNNVDASGKVTPGLVQPIVIGPDKQFAPPEITTQIDFNGNLKAEAGATRETTMGFYDSLGNWYEIEVVFKYDSDATEADPDKNSTWTFELKGTTTGTAGSNTVNVRPTINGETADFTLPFTFTNLPTVTFDKDGYLTGVGQGVTLSFDNPIGDPPANIGAPPATGGGGGTGGGAATTTGEIWVSFDGLKQFGNTTSTAKASSNGLSAGKLTTVTYGDDGIITGSYANGTTQVLAQIPVARFQNPNGLESVGSNLFAITANSGPFDGVGEEAKIGTESIMPGCLEMSSVDLASEFTEMITTQRGLQANSRIITTSDEILQEIVNLKR